jgi:hypothetical protein
VRYTCTALGHQLGAVLGGFSPLIAGALSAAAGDSWYPVALYVAVSCLISSLCVYASRETFRNDVHDTGVAPAEPGGRFTRALHGRELYEPEGRHATSAPADGVSSS